METKKVSQKNHVDNLAVCKKDLDGKVLSQNESCEKICGRREGQICSADCMLWYKAENPGNAEGTFQFRDTTIEDRQFDVLMVNDGEQILTLLFDLAHRHSARQKFFKQFHLSAREEEILACVIKKLPNKQIADQLCISEKTLKTHINNLLKKIPRNLWPRAKPTDS